MSFERLKKMQTPKGFYELWMERVREGRTHKEAYYLIEEEYEEFWGETRYSSFDSFRLSQRERIMSKQQKVS